jgi:hypothetical protein
MKCEKSAKRTWLTGWAIRHVVALGMEHVCHVRHVMMRRTKDEVEAFIFSELGCDGKSKTCKGKGK